MLDGTRGEIVREIALLKTGGLLESFFYELCGKVKALYPL